jgi:hypothetical protein
MKINKSNGNLNEGFGWNLFGGLALRGRGDGRACPNHGLHPWLRRGGQVIHGLIPATAGRNFRIILFSDANDYLSNVETTKWSNHE